MNNSLDKVLQGRSFFIWGLNDFSHSHSYIHANFFNVLKRNRIKVEWLENRVSNNERVKPNSIVLFVNHDSQNLRFLSNRFYIGHNCHEVGPFQDFLKAFPERALNYLFHSNEVTGKKDPSGSIAKYDATIRTISQPYGTPLDEIQFNSDPITVTSKGIENWVGSVWQDEKGGGNLTLLSDFSKEIGKHEVKLRAIELGFLARTKINVFLERKLIRESFLAASLHTKHQVESDYLACRAFKAISFGRVLHTNQEAFHQIFFDSVNASKDLKTLIEKALEFSPQESKTMHKNSLEILRNYTYEKGIYRLISALDGEW